MNQGWRGKNMMKHSNLKKKWILLEDNIINSNLNKKKKMLPEKREELRCSCRVFALFLTICRSLGTTPSWTKL